MTERAYTPGGAKKATSADALAEKIVGDRELITDDSGTVYAYAGGAWQPLSEQALLALAHAAGARQTSRLRDVAGLVKAKTYMGAIPWGRVTEYEVPCANGIVDVVTGELRAHEPEHYLERVVPVRYDPSATAEAWEQCLVDWFGDGEDDGDRALGLQCFVGYVLASHARYKKAAVLFGPPDTGKTVPPQVMKMLVGAEYTCQLSVEDMDDPVRRSIIKGKALNMLTELPSTAMIADGGFKTLVSTEEPISLDPKYKAPETYTPTAKHVIATNVLPRITDHTEATFRRLLIIPFDKPIEPARQNRGLLADLRRELPGILNWAMRGLKRLVDGAGQWPEVRAATRALELYKDDLNPIRQFIAERMDKTETHAVTLSAVTREFNKWNVGGGRVDVKRVGRMLRAAGLGQKIGKVRHGAQVLSTLKGFRLASAADDEVKLSGTVDVVDGEQVERSTEPSQAAPAARAFSRARMPDGREVPPSPEEFGMDD